MAYNHTIYTICIALVLLSAYYLIEIQKQNSLIKVVNKAHFWTIGKAKTEQELLVLDLERRLDYASDSRLFPKVLSEEDTFNLERRAIFSKVG